MRVRFTLVATGLSLVIATTACTAPSTTPSSSPSATTATESKTLTVVTHDSFSLPDALKKKFATDTGYDVKYVAPGDGGALANQLILTKDSPLGDVVYGLDNASAARVIAEGTLSPYQPAGASELEPGLDADDSHALTPIDRGDVCVNADSAWFAAKKLAVPASLDDLTKPEYKDLLVVENPASSSPGLAFLVATYGAKGEGWLGYWDKLKANGVKVVKGWTEAYSVEFSGGEGKGTRPLVVSYSTSPAFTVKNGASSTTALLNTCFRQVEYAGVLKGAKNEVGARKFIDFLLTAEVQGQIPTSMYMYPAVKNVALPPEWVTFAPLSPNPITVPASDIANRRDSWIREWTDRVIG